MADNVTMLGQELGLIDRYWGAANYPSSGLEAGWPELRLARKQDGDRIAGNRVSKLALPGRSQAPRHRGCFR